MSIKSKNNVIQFPRTHSTAPNSPEEVGNKIREYKESYSSELSEIIWENVLGEMARAGCDLEEDVELYFPSMILIFEAIRSLHLMTMGVDHELQDFAEDHVFVADESGEGSMTGGFMKKVDETIDIDEDL
jgi:hypothetical protein